MLDVIRHSVLENLDLTVLGGSIASLNPTGREIQAARVIDGRGRLVMPGLINAHAHTPMTLFRATTEAVDLQAWRKWQTERSGRYTEEDIYWGSMLAMGQMLRSGVTAFADNYVRQSITGAAVERTGMRALLTETIIGGPSPAFRGPVDEQLRRAEELVAKWHGSTGGRITAGLGPHSTYTCDPGLLREIAQMAAARGTGVNIHVSETATENEVCWRQFGERPVRLAAAAGCFDGHAIAAHCVHVDSNEISLLAELGVGIAHNPGCNLKLGSGRAPLCEMLAAGLKVGIGTDSAGTNDSLSLWRDIFLAAVLHEWPAQEDVGWEVLELATQGAASVLGIDDLVGSVTVGKRADLVLVNLAHPDLNPLNDVARALVYSMSVGAVDTVMVDGVMLVEGGRVISFAEDEAVVECQTRAARIFGDEG